MRDADAYADKAATFEDHASTRLGEVVTNLEKVADETTARSHKADQFETVASKRLEEVVLRLENVANEIATRAIARFPDNISPIVTLISGAHTRVLIASDVAAYGQLSNATHSTDYIHTVAGLASTKNVDVKVISYSGECADKERRKQFEDYVKSGEAGLKALLDEDRWRQFSRKHPHLAPRNFDDFFNALLRNDAECRRNFANAGVDVYELSDINLGPPVFFWVRDKEEAIFSLFTEGEKAREVSFRTKDPAIIQMLVDTFEAAQAQAVRVAPAV